MAVPLLYLADVPRSLSKPLAAAAAAVVRKVLDHLEIVRVSVVEAVEVHMHEKPSIILLVFILLRLVVAVAQPLMVVNRKLQVQDVVLMVWLQVEVRRVIQALRLMVMITMVVMEEQLLEEMLINLVVKEEHLVITVTEMVLLIVPTIK